MERALDTGLSLEACRRADNGAQCAYENILELPGAAEAQSFFHEGCPGNQLTLNPDQQAQARLSTGTGGLGLPSTIARRMSASLGSRVGILPESLADLTGPLGDRVRTGLPETSIIAHLGGSLREIRDMGGLEGSDGRNRPRVLAGIGLGEEGDRASRPPEADVLAAHDAVTTNSRKAQQKLGRLVNQGRHACLLYTSPSPRD